MEITAAIVKIDVSNARYPTEWRGLPDAPETVYASGDISLLQTQKLTVVGSRRTPAQMLAHTKTIAKALSQSLTIVTGVADGGDLAAVEGALAGSGRVICVLAGGFGALPQCNLPILEQVAKKGLILALHDFKTGVRAFSYGYRNKMIAALGTGVFVVGAGDKSGALVTAKCAREQGKPVFAFPYPPNAYGGVGCNALLKTGGYLVENAEDITERLGVQHGTEKPRVTLSETEERVLNSLQALGEGHVSEIAQRAELPLFKARAALSALEVKGLAVNVGGNRYAAV